MRAVRAVVPLGSKQGMGKLKEGQLAEQRAAVRKSRELAKHTGRSHGEELWGQGGCGFSKAS